MLETILIATTWPPLAVQAVVYALLLLALWAMN
jgi:hypothetical protein